MNKNRVRAIKYLSDYTLEKMKNLAAGLVYKRVDVKSDFGHNCYTKCDSNPVEIVLGVDFLGSKKEYTYSEVRTCYMSIYFHELGHVVFTNLDSIKDYTEEDKQFIFPFINIHEDYVVERAMGFIFNVDALLNRAQKLLFNYIDKVIEEESHQGFIAGFQAIHRFGEETARRNKIIDKNWEFISTNYFRIADILDPVERFNQQVWFSKKLLELLKDEGIDPVEDYNQFIEELANYLQEALESIMKSSGNGDQAQDMTNGKDSQGNDGDEEKNEESSMVQALKELKESLESMNENIDSQIEDTENNPDRPWEQIIAEQDNGVVIKGVNRNSSYHKVNNYTDAKIQMAGIIRQLEEAIKKCGIDYRESISGQLQGSFNLREAMRPNNLRVYNRVIDMSTDPDNLCFDILVDVSGSMTGECAKIAGMCTIAICEALENTHVDYRLHLYSSDYLMIKDERQKLRTCIDALEKILNSSGGSYRNLSLWCGNNETLAMQALKDNSKNIHKQKVLIHIGDGGFYFNNRNHISNKMEKCGYITTLGVGLMCDEMSKYHKNSITVMNSSEFGKLPKAILDYVASIFR